MTYAGFEHHDVAENGLQTRVTQEGWGQRCELEPVANELAWAFGARQTWDGTGDLEVLEHEKDHVPAAQVQYIYPSYHHRVLVD